jgi:hypothetical protein
VGEQVVALAAVGNTGGTGGPTPVVKTEKLTPAEAAKVLVQHFRENVDQTLSQIQTSINYLGTCRTEAMKNSLHRNVAEECAKLINRFQKIQKAAQGLMEDRNGMSDQDVKKIMTSHGNAETAMKLVENWAQTNKVAEDPNAKDNKRRKKKL